eukprot:Hpha_TRINITY_DN13458_c0_g2::TRINITY_DN13458_c0_g2_i1::g.130794::m.130794
MFREGRRGQGDRSNLPFAVGGGVIVVIFLIAYSWGSRKQGATGEKQVGEILHRGDYLRTQLKACQNKTKLSEEAAADLRGETQVLYTKSRQLETENSRLDNVRRKLLEDKVGCEEELGQSLTRWKAEDRESFTQQLQMEAEVGKLRQEVTALDKNTGMRSTVLLALIKELGKEHQGLKQELDGGMPIKVNTKYVDTLVDKWKKIDEDMKKQGKPGPMSVKEGEVLAVNASEIPDRPIVKVLDRYDPDRHASKIFIPTRGYDGVWQLPGWNKRQGTQRVRKGTFAKTKYNPVTDINRQMRILYEYALCAVAKNVTNFMYPSSFKRCKKCKDEFVHQYLETPLVLFCDECIPQHTSNAFKLLCSATSAKAEYGSELFWRMRSRLLFKGTFRNSADHWMAENFFREAGLDPRDKDLRVGATIAVRLSHIGNKDWDKKCADAQKHNRPVLAYEKLLKGRDGVKEVSTDVAEQCSPSLAKVTETVNGLVKELGGKDVRIYLSAGSELTDKEFLQITKTFNAPTYRRRPSERPTEDEIVDTLIASTCDRLVLNRFDLKSSMILEAHMLYNDLKVTGTTVF